MENRGIGGLLKGKVAVITGGAVGIGKASTELFARHGADVVCIDRNDAAGQATVDAVRREGLSCVYRHVDVTSSGDLAALAEALEVDFGRVDVLFNNAGVPAQATFEGTSDALWDEMVAANLTHHFRCSKQLLPLLKKGNKASIVHHASIDAFLGNASIAAYSAAKGGLIPLTHVMAHDLGKYGIRVNSISSGGVRAMTRQTSDDLFQSRVRVTPLGRRGDPEEVAHVALFLASDWSSYVNAANIVVDGGRTAITQGTYGGYDTPPVPGKPA